MAFHIERLTPDHDRVAFSCGVPDIDNALIAFNFDRAVPASRIYVALNEDDEIVGYYCLRPAIWDVKSRGKHKARIESSIEIELAWMGVRQDLQGRGIVGPELIVHAFQTVVQVAELVGGIQRLWVGPLNEQCRKFYRSVDFIETDLSPRMWIMVEAIADAIAE